jgi:hypothetical protein
MVLNWSHVNRRNLSSIDEPRDGRRVKHMNKRVYKFISAKYGISDLEKRRLKVSTIDDLNDPFDIQAIDTSDPRVANAVEKLIVEFRESRGLLCFSRNWDNLLLWSHYASAHSGICLGFDIPDRSTEEAMISVDVRYQPNVLKICDKDDVNFDFAKRLLSTKHESWSYEQEVRMFVGFNEPADSSGLRWFPFGPDLRLREVIVGVQCSAEHVRKVCAVLSTYPCNVECEGAYMRSDAFLLFRDRTDRGDVFRR